MIDGIRIAPHAYAHRRQDRLHGTGAQQGYLDCTECQRTLGEVERRAIRCGYLPRLPDPDPEPDPAKRPPHPYLPPHAPRPVCQECPGYLIALPQVREALIAYHWWDKGQLATFIDGQRAAPYLRELVSIASGAAADAETAYLAELKHRD